MMPTWTAWVLLAACAALAAAAVRLCRVSRSIRDVSQQLEHLSSLESNEKLHLQSSTKSLRLAVNELNAALAHLRQEKLRIRNADASLQSALAGWSHDLRTPLTAVRGYVSLLQDESLTDKAADYLRIVSARLSALEDILEDLFSISLALSDSRKLDEDPVDLVAVTEEAAASFYDALTRRGLQVEMETPEHPVLAPASQHALSRVLYNLLSNALKYAQEFVHVCVTADCCICIENDAANFDPALLQVLLDPHSSLDVVSPARYGMGLSSARLLCERMNARLGASCTDNTLHMEVVFPPLQET